ncbi:MAG: leucine-rich repeat protein [Candidatus Methanomethylophilaceae archaeon]
MTIPDSVISIGNYAFHGCAGLTSVTIGNSVTSIGDRAFYNCTGLTSVTIPDSVTSIGDYAFHNCTGLTKFIVPEDNANYSSDENGILYNKNKTSLIQCPEGYEGGVVIPDSVTSIGDFAFYKCTGLTSVTIPDSVISIGDYAFYNCTGLTSIIIPGSVTDIGEQAFYNMVLCSEDGTTILGHTPGELSGHSFAGTYERMVRNGHTVTYEVDGGSSSAPTQPIIGKGQVFIIASYEGNKAGHTFAGWGEGDNVYETGDEYTVGDSDVVLTAIWDINQYTITWTVEGVTTDTQVLDYGATPVYAGVAPTKAADAQYTYAFSGWDPVISTVTGHQTYAAVFTETLRAYTITWTVEGVTTDTQVLDYGATPVYAGVAPTKAADAQYTYAFSGWDPVISTVTGHQTYAAVFTETLRAYTITWTVEGVTTDTQVLDYGATPVYAGVAPTKAADAQYTYAFSGWDPVISTVTGHQTYAAVFTETLRAYTITWTVEGVTTDTQVLDYGATPVYAGVAPTKAADAQYTYAFSGWDPVISTVTGHQTYAAVFTETLRAYTITWTVEGVTTDTQVLDYGATPVYAGVAPTKAADAQYTYAFSGWDPVISTVTGHQTYAAVFTETLRAYTITWSVDGVTTTTQADHGTMPAYAGTPAKAATPEYTYAFAGWTPGLVEATADTTYTAEFTATPVDYTITFDSDGGSAVGAMTVAFGAAVTAPTAPTKTGYAFSGWSPALPATMPAENRTVTAIWSVNQYTITFDSAGGTAVASMTQDYGTTVSAPAAPTKTGHYLYGMDPGLAGDDACGEQNGNGYLDHQPVHLNLQCQRRYGLGSRCDHGRL